MVEIIEQTSSVTAEEFVDFVYDMLKDAFLKHVFPLKLCDVQERKTERVYVESFSNAVLLYHKFNVDLFANCLLEREDGDDDMEYVELYCHAIFDGKNHHMEIIHYCAFIYDLGVYFLFEDPDMIDSLINNAAVVFDEYIKPHFSKCGGWDALYRAANEYFAYGNFLENYGFVTDGSRLQKANVASTEDCRSF